MSKSFCSKEFNRFALLFVSIFSIGILANSAALAAIKATEKKSADKIGWNHSFLERRKSSLNLVAAKKSPQLLTSSSETLLGITDQCQTASQINFGQSVNGQLTSADCRLPDGSYADFYIFTGTQGEQITITMNSAAVDSYLGLASESGSLQIEDDDSGGGLNSKIVATLPETGLYVILANSALPNQFGNYTLTLSASSSCTYSLAPTSADVPATGGSFTFAVNTQAGCQWNGSTFNNDFITATGSGVGSGNFTYTVASNNFEVPRTGTIRVGGQTFTVRQAPKVCNYSISSSSVSLSAAKTTGSFAVTANPGCFWRVDTNDLFISHDNIGGTSGSNIVNYTVETNNGAARTGTLTAAGKVFTITQAGLNCTFTISPNVIVVNRFEQSGTIAITTQPGCAWWVSRTQWILIDTIDTTGSGTFSYKVLENFGTLARTERFGIFGTNSAVTITQTGTALKPTQFDYDGDGRADISAFRPESGNWYVNQTTTGFSNVQFGMGSDRLVPADYDGDGKADVAVFRPDNGTWYLRRSAAGFTSVQFGQTGDVPVPADFTGDGKAEIAVYRPSNGVWYTLDLTSNQFKSQQWGAVNDKPLVGDFDGDGKSDYAVYRPENGTWYLLQSTAGFKSQQWGEATDKLVPADYDGDGKTDIAVWRPSNGNWYLLKSRDGFASRQFGALSDQVAPADYDGDGRSDFAVFRPETGMWYLQQSTNGFAFQQFGQANDRAVPNSFVP